MTDTPKEDQYFALGAEIKSLRDDLQAAEGRAHEAEKVIQNIIRTFYIQASVSSRITQMTNIAEAYFAKEPTP